ncbi:MAG: NAD(P)/FAD-dependent oxidoreductase [Dehalococcoidia bacterium]
MPDSYDATVVGSGPNGLAAAITMARSGHSVLVLESGENIGGGMRSAELTLPGFIHDICSAVHPLALASPFFRSLDLSRYGLEWIHPPIPLAHPTDEGKAMTLERSVQTTADWLEPDGVNYRRLMKPLVEKSDELLYELLQPLHFPSHPLALLRFGIHGVHSLDYFNRNRFKGERARALFTGLAAHSILPTDHSGSGGFGLMLGITGHALGWPSVKGGSQNLAEALAKCLASLGGEIRTSTDIKSFNEIPTSRAVFFDLTPRQVDAITGNKFAGPYRRRLQGHRHGPGVFKIDWALDGPIPWRSPECCNAGTVHVGGSSTEIAGAENEVWLGKHAERPLVILAQQSLFDPTRAPGGKQTAWAYCHVPNGSTTDMTERIEAQVERFAPGFRDVILARSVMNTAELEDYNPNYVGGDIAGGVQSLQNLFLRPLGQWKPYITPAEGIYICSSSMPPGAGVHGMCGYHAARRALRELFSVTPKDND